MKKPPKLPGMILMDAQRRLLPPLLPFLFFIVAAINLNLAAEERKYASRRFARLAYDGPTIEFHDLGSLL